ncbi:MAG: choice-of-anchor R domain-containing protein [Verrucomicrobiota bacterium]|nr:hypothetical protein [Limisphaera sp.]MDW8381089.1 choice-of-anchor R domain-containing protein [Verrucomicrobiota bacterium]
MRTTHLALATASALALAASPARAAVVFDTLSGHWESEATLSESLWVAQAFGSGLNNLLTGIKLNLYGGSGTFGVELWDIDSQNKPGSLITTIGNFSSPTTPSQNNVVNISGLNVSINPNSTYYVVVKATSAGGSVNWGSTTSSDQNVSGSPMYSVVYNGGSWGDVDEENPQRMMVEAVPEASTWLAGAFAGLIILGGVARRKLLHRRVSGAAS